MDSKGTDHNSDNLSVRVIDYRSKKERNSEDTLMSMKCVWFNLSNCQGLKP